MSMLHSIAVKTVRSLTPVRKNRVVFSSYGGRGYSDSPKAICEVLRQSGEDLDLIWLCKDEDAAGTLPEGVRAVPTTGLKKVRAMASAKVWVDNCRKYDSHKKKNQIYMQTWHGFALKKIERDAESILEHSYVEAAKRDSAQCDVIISGSGFMSKIYRESFWYQGAVMNTGTPRNDIFYTDHALLHAKVCKALGLPEERKLALYAPTFRDDHSVEAYRLDADMVRRKCEENFKGEWTVLIRLHPNAASQSAGLFAYDGDRLVDATTYPDMQELLCAAGLLITDYSSSMFDYALTGKPVVQFAIDIESYQKDRDFYFPLDQLPFPLARSDEELETILTDLQPLWTNSAWAEFTREHEFCEDGQASIRCAAIILQQIRKED
ncbi:MAG: CDP-glycerol glycerophosphotransferase family protein [Oscillospiraceae bacterium]|nr:CDP-glycerol glycerophosphotransferase family protein [Oscillospiraceae bacterium]